MPVAMGSLSPSDVVTGLLPASGWVFPPLRSTQTNRAPCSSTGQWESVDVLRCPAVSRTGIQAPAPDGEAGRESIDTIPSESMTQSADFSLNPAHDSDDPGLSAETFPDPTTEPSRPSYTA